MLQNPCKVRSLFSAYYILYLKKKKIYVFSTDLLSHCIVLFLCSIIFYNFIFLLTPSKFGRNQDVPPPPEIIPYPHPSNYFWAVSYFIFDTPTPVIISEQSLILYLCFIFVFYISVVFWHSCMNNFEFKKEVIDMSIVINLANDSNNSFLQDHWDYFISTPQIWLQ